MSQASRIRRTRASALPPAEPRYFSIDGPIGPSKSAAVGIMISPLDVTSRRISTRRWYTFG